jgi:hypothetical protein
MPLHRAIGAAHDAAIARGVGQAHGQQRQLLRPAPPAMQPPARAAVAGLGQRHIAREHDHGAVVLQLRHGLLHGVAGAQLRLLAHKFQVKLASNAYLHLR